MTPKEIAERVKVRNESDRVRCGGMELPSSSFQRCSDIDHLLAIHAAAVEMFDAEESAEMADNAEAYFSSEHKARQCRFNLAALCGWTTESP